MATEGVYAWRERERERVRGVKSILILNEVVYKEVETWLTKGLLLMLLIKLN